MRTQHAIIAISNDANPNRLPTTDAKVGRVYVKLREHVTVPTPPKHRTPDDPSHRENSQCCIYVTFNVARRGAEYIMKKKKKIHEIHNTYTTHERGTPRENLVSCVDTALPASLTTRANVERKKKLPQFLLSLRSLATAVLTLHALRRRRRTYVRVPNV